MMQITTITSGYNRISQRGVGVVSDGTAAGRYASSISDVKDSEQTSHSRGNKKANSPQTLSPKELREVQGLKARDHEVRAHEAAHMAAGAELVRGGMSFDYRSGPDGRRYAVGGEVSIDSSPVHDDPQATINKAQRVRTAALAPAEPSPQDRAVAADATRMAAEAKFELAQQNMNSRNAISAYNDGTSSEQGKSLDQTV